MIKQKANRPLGRKTYTHRPAVKKYKRLLFICQGNVSRSQMAEAFYNHLTEGSYGLSAGVDLTVPGRYRNPDKFTIQVMDEVGISIQRQLVHSFAPFMLQGVDGVITMVPPDKLPDHVLRYLVGDQYVDYWDISDTFEKDLPFYRIVRDMIKEKVEKLV
jgi:arsenate reductase